MMKQLKVRLDTVLCDDSARIRNAQIILNFLPQKHNAPTKVDRDRTQRSMLSYITVRRENTENPNHALTSSKYLLLILLSMTVRFRISTDLFVADSKSSDCLTVGNCHSLLASTSENVDQETKVSTPKIDLQGLCDSAYDELIARLGNSFDESLLDSTPRRKRSHLRNSGAKDRKRILVSTDAELPGCQLYKRTKLSQSPTKSSCGNLVSECCDFTRSSPEKENDSCGCIGVLSKISPPAAARSILQEVMVQGDDSPPKKHSTDDFVDIENLGDFLNEDWSKEFSERE